MMCSVASAADSVIVMTKSVAAKPSSMSYDRFALPAREERFEHHDAALTVRARLGNPVIHRKRAEQA